VFADWVCVVKGLHFEGNIYSSYLSAPALWPDAIKNVILKVRILEPVVGPSKCVFSHRTTRHKKVS
jgi:hypothetical protein